MLVQKTVQRHAVTLEHGAFEARETVHACKAGCQFANGQLVTRRAQQLAQRIPARKVVGYDVMVHVGLQRYLHHRQREEIRTALEHEHGIVLSSSEISIVAGRFLEYLQALHEARSPALQAQLATDGGWPLHVDATGESGRGTILAAFTSWRGWVLGAWKIPTERADAILPRLREIVTHFGPPCAIMRDLGRAMIPAVQGLIDELPEQVVITVLSCHLHFLSDIGTDLLDPAHSKLRSLLRTLKVRPGLRALARELSRELGNHLQQGRDALKDWLDDEAVTHRVPEGLDGLAVTRGLCQWVLDYAADARCGSFPFNRPYLDLYDRCCAAHRAIHAFLQCPPEDRKVRRTLERLLRIVDAVATDEPTAELVDTLRKRASLFDELRDTLRLVGTCTPHTSECSSAPQDAPANLQAIRVTFDQWVEQLREQRPQRGPAGDIRQAIDLILDHVDRHGATLWGHAIERPAQAGGGVRLVDRTNNCQENLFHTVKHGERRRSGRKVLTHDFETLPAAALLVENLKHDDYVAVLCGTLDGLPGAFAELDAQQANDQRQQPPAERTSAPTAQQPVVSASLPTLDRRIVRTDAMDTRVGNAARSRAPRSPWRPDDPIEKRNPTVF